MKYFFYTAFAALAACASAPQANADQVNKETVETEATAVSAAAPVEKPKLENLLPSAPEKSLARQADFAEAMQDVAERQKVFKDEPTRFFIDGVFSQGGLVFGQTEPGAEVRLDGDNVMVGEDGKFVFGFGRDSAPSALLVVTLPDGVVERHAIDVADREFPVQRIDGLDQSKVSGFTEEQLAKIAVDSAKKEKGPCDDPARGGLGRWLQLAGDRTDQRGFWVAAYSQWRA